MDGQGNGLNISGLLVTVMLLASWFFQYQPLHTLRPADEQLIQEVVQQQVPARLWQDPFTAVQRHLRAVEDPDSVGLRGDDIAGQIAAAGAEHTAVYMVFLQEDPYAEARELRLRTRYAVASALGEVGYKPRNNRRLGLWRRSRVGGDELHIAFEWFDAMDDGQQPRRVLLLWLPEGELGESPLTGLQNLLDDLSAPRLADAALIGPTNSDTLEQMVQEQARLAA